MGSTDISSDAQEGNEEFSVLLGSDNALFVLEGQSLKRVALICEGRHRS
jgi:hypothetical protein